MKTFEKPLINRSRYCFNCGKNCGDIDPECETCSGLCFLVNHKI